MSSSVRALDIIKKYEGYSERAYPDPATGEAPYTLGYGTQFYPDGSAVKRGQCCTKKKALEYLLHDIEIIEDDLKKLNLGLDSSMEEALGSFIHSVGWEAFLYSRIIDFIEDENWPGVVKEISNWIFDEHHQVIGGLIDRRREECNLFLEQIKEESYAKGDVLLEAFRSYVASPGQIKAIQTLEEQINPYVLANFANSFILDNYGLDNEDERFATLLDNWT